jgi:sensor histidine kinase YesM
MRTAQARAEQALTVAQLEAIKSRLHPHFLFNTLHTIGALMEREPARATRMIQNLSDLLRLALSRRDRAMATVADELEAVHLYLAIQKDHFGERLSFNESIDDDALPCLIPDMLLQPLVENAVIHGIAPLRRGGEVSIEIRTGTRMIVAIRDDGAGAPDDLEEGIGLGTTRERLDQLYGGDHHFSIQVRPQGGTVVIIDLPIRKATE